MKWMGTKLYVKDMVSARYKTIVQSELEKLGLKAKTIDLGEIELEQPVTAAQKEQLGAALEKSGMELIDDRKTILLERVKNAIVEMVYNSDELPQVNFSVYLADKLNYDYTYLSNTFSSLTGITIEQFTIMTKIEKAKNLMLYERLSINEIADKLGYSSSAHLSNQFKKTTGLTPSFFKAVKRGNM
jgi:hypothetical protein